MHTSVHFAVTVLGSGTCTPSTRRGAPGYVVRHGHRSYLVDSGSGTIQRLVRAGLRPVDLEALFYTHTHLDHVGDLFPLLFSLRNAYGEHRRHRALVIHGPPGFQTFFARLAQVFPDCVDGKHFEVRVREMCPETGAVPLGHGLAATAIPLQHATVCVGFRFADDEGRTVAFTGDTDACPALEELVRDADLVIAECSTPDSLKLPGHLSPTLLGHACQAAGARCLVLSHFYPPSDDEDIVSAVQKVFHGMVVKAEDGATYEPGPAR